MAKLYEEVSVKVASLDAGGKLFRVDDGNKPYVQILMTAKEWKEFKEFIASCN
jgi:hypothetical protein